MMLALSIQTSLLFVCSSKMYPCWLSTTKVPAHQLSPTTALTCVCSTFLVQIDLETFQKVVGGFVGLVDKLAKGVDAEKMKAIGAKSAFESAHKRKEAEEQLLMATIAEKKAQLERLKVEQQSLETIIQEQDQFIEHYVMRK
eukprot:m.96699 g.96699  ORF g.96699 m.96699 type:complete len:142 (-) comp13082_c0_seq1:296-721(-)